MRCPPGLRATLLALVLPLSAAAQDAIGRVNIAGYNSRGMCSGTLVAPALVLTAAHCVLDPHGRAKPVADMVFVAGWDRDRHAAAARIDAVRAHPRAIGETGVSVAHDLALLDLAEPLDLPPLPPGAAAPAGPFTLSGYTRRRPYRRTEIEGCRGTARAALWRLDCSVDYGQSGGPVLFGDGEARRVVAVISARDGAGALVVPLDRWARAEIARAYTPSGG